MALPEVVPAELAVVLEAAQVLASEVVSVVAWAADPPVVPVAPVALRSVALRSVVLRSVALRSVPVFLHSGLAHQPVLASEDFLLGHFQEPDMQYLVEAFPLASEGAQVVPE